MFVHVMGNLDSAAYKIMGLQKKLFIVRRVIIDSKQKSCEETMATAMATILP